MGNIPERSVAIAAVARHVEAGSVAPMRDAAADLGMERATLRRWMHEHRKAGNDLQSAADKELHKAAREGELGFDPVLPGFAVTQVKTQQDAEGRATSHSITQKPHADQSRFEIPEGFELARGTVHVRDDHVVQHWPRYAPAVRDPKVVAGEFATALNNALRPAAVRPAPTGTLDDWLTVYPIVDWHVGLLAWSEETGGQNWDTSIARDAILDALGQVIGISKKSKRALLLNSGDMMHFDGYVPMTSRSGNVLDTDTRYPKIRRTAVAMFDEAIQMALEHHEQVEVVSLPGNHDDQSAGWIALALDMKYRDHPRVHVDTGSNRMWWRRYENVFLGSTHGDKAKPADLPLVMAVDNPMDWALSTRRVIYTGHIHHETLKEEGGVRVFSLRTPTPKDAYHSWEKYRAGRSVYSDTYSLDGRFHTRETMDL